MCKPHKKGWADKRTRQEVKADDAARFVMVVDPVMPDEVGVLGGEDMLPRPRPTFGDRRIA
jgi:hypothetical protein